MRCISTTSVSKLLIDRARPVCRVEGVQVVSGHAARADVLEELRDEAPEVST